MERRKYLATITTAVGGAALAGCLTNELSGGDNNDRGNSNGDGGGSTEVENPASQLGVTGFMTASEEENNVVFQAEVEVENPTDQSVTADFSATISPFGGGGDLTSDSVEQTIPSGEREQFRIDIADAEGMQFEQLTGIYFRGFQLQIAVNGEPKPEVCPDADVANPTSEGCEYPFGVYETYVEVEYGGNWQGSFGSTGGQRTVSRSSAAFGAPAGSDISYVNIDDSSDIISANAQKQDASTEELIIRIVHQDGIYAEQSTSTEYGVAQVSTNVATDSPIRERNIGGRSGESASPSMSPEEFIKFLVNVVYNDADDRYRYADDAARTLNSLVHPDQRGEVTPGRDLPSPEALADDSVTFELVESEVVEERSADNVVVRVVYTQSSERSERFYELRVGPENEWYIWNVGT